MAATVPRRPGGSETVSRPDGRSEISHEPPRSPFMSGGQIPREHEMSLAQWVSSAVRAGTAGSGMDASIVLDAMRSAGSTPIVQSFPYGAMTVFDHDLRFLSAGGVGLGDIGLSREILVGNTIFEVFPADVAVAIEPRYRLALTGQETDVDVPSGGRIYLHRLGPVRNPAGEIVAGMGFLEDVTLARRGERELRESEELFRLAFDNAPIGMALISLDGRYERVNAAMCRFTGYSEAQLGQLSVADITHPDDLSADRAVMAAALAGDRSSPAIDERYRTPSGAYVWGAKSATLVRRHDGSPRHFIAQIQDITLRKTQEEGLVEANRRLRHAETVGRVGSWEMDVATGAVTRSAGLLELWGLEPDQVGANLKDTLRSIHPDDVAAVNAAVDACARTGERLHVRYRVTRARDGATRWLDTRGERSHEDGRPARIVGLVADVTERVLADAEAVAARSFQQAVMAATPDIVMVYDFRSMSVAWSNRAITDVLGYCEAEVEAMAGDLVGHLVPADHRAAYDAAFEAMREAGDDDRTPVEYPLRNAAGDLQWFSRRTASLHRDDDGRITQIVGVLRDTTEVRAHERALRVSEAQFRQLAASIDVAFLLRSWEPPTFLYVSPVYEKIFGYDPTVLEETPQQLLQRVHPDDRDRFHTEYWSRSEAGLPARLDYRILRPDGEVRWVRATAYPASEPGALDRRTASTVADITDSRRAEAALRRADSAEEDSAAKTKFLSRVSHELRTPLDAVLGFAQLLELDPLSRDQQESVQHILAGGQHLLGLIDDVLDITGIEGDRLALNIDAVTLPELLSETVALMAPLAAAASVRVQYHPGPAPTPDALADSRRLRQVVLRLLSNAINYNRPGGRVDVRCALSQDAARIDIAVEDSGLGIDFKGLERIFSPFARPRAQATGIEGPGVAWRCPTASWRPWGAACGRSRGSASAAPSPPRSR